MKPLILFLTVLALLFFFVGRELNVEMMLQSLGSLSIDKLLLLLFLTTILSALKAVRFYILLQGCHIQLSFLKTWKVLAASQLFTSLPGGEAGRSMVLEKENDTPIVKSSSPVVTQALLELLSGVVIFLIGSFFYEQFLIPAFTALVIIITLFFVVTYKKFSFYLIEKLSKYSFIKPHLSKITYFQKTFRSTVFTSEGKISWVMLGAFGTALLSHIIGGLLIFSIGKILNVPLNFVKSTFIYGSSVAIQGLSLIPGGLGVTEGGMTGLLLLSKIKPIEAVTVVILFRFFTLILPILVGFLLMIIFYRKLLWKP